MTQHDRIQRMTRKGWRVVSTLPDGSVVLERKARIGLWLNLILTVVTAGFWLIAIAIKLANRRTESYVIPADASAEAAHATRPVAPSSFPSDQR